MQVATTTRRSAPHVENDRRISDRRASSSTKTNVSDARETGGGTGAAAARLDLRLKSAAQVAFRDLGED